MPVRYYLSPLTNPLPPGERERRAQERRDYYIDLRASEAALKAPRMGEGTCAQCGTRFPKRFGGRGRPQEYCSEECREFSAALTILKKWAEPVAKRSTAAAWSNVRRSFWSLANASPAFQKDNAARLKARRAEEASLIAAGIIPVKGKQKVTFELVIGGNPISDTVYATQASAKTAAKAFSREYPTVVVDVRTVLGKERKARFRAGKSVELLDAYKEFGDTDLRLNRGRGR
jgi:hypothetical protein